MAVLDAASGRWTGHAFTELADLFLL